MHLSGRRFARPRRPGAGAWTEAIASCLADAATRLPRALDRRELAEFVLTTMEGSVMQARTHRDVAYFDRSVRQLRAYFDHLEQAAQRPQPPRAPPRKGTTKHSATKKGAVR